MPLVTVKTNLKVGTMKAQEGCTHVKSRNLFRADKPLMIYECTN